MFSLPFTTLQPHRPSVCFSDARDSFTLQGLCTSPSFCLTHSSCDLCLTDAFPSLWTNSKGISSKRSTLSTLSKVPLLQALSLTSPYFIFFIVMIAFGAYLRNVLVYCMFPTLKCKPQIAEFLFVLIYYSLPRA